MLIFLFPTIAFYCMYFIFQKINFLKIFFLLSILDVCFSVLAATLALLRAIIHIFKHIVKKIYNFLVFFLWKNYKIKFIFQRLDYFLIMV